MCTRMCTCMRMHTCIHTRTLRSPSSFVPCQQVRMEETGVPDVSPGSCRCAARRWDTLRGEGGNSGTVDAFKNPTELTDLVAPIDADCDILQAYRHICPAGTGVCPASISPRMSCRRQCAQCQPTATVTRMQTKKLNKLCGIFHQIVTRLLLI